MPTPEAGRIIEVVGEGKTDHGPESDQPEPLTRGVVPVLVHRLCDRPDSMRVRCKPLPRLRGKGSWQKVRFAKKQAFYNESAGLVFVIDTEGDHPGQLEQLQRGRDFELPDYPAAIGVAHPCIEAWLLADASAISRVLGLTQRAEVPEVPGALPAPCKDRKQNPKSVLGRCAGQDRPLSAAQTTRTVQENRDLDAIRTRCPISFAPLADEVIGRIRPIFETNESDPANS